MPQNIPPNRCESRLSVANSVTTHHSFPDLDSHDAKRAPTPYVDVVEYPEPPERPSNPMTEAWAQPKYYVRVFSRQDYGYASREAASLSSHDSNEDRSRTNTISKKLCKRGTERRSILAPREDGSLTSPILQIPHAVPQNGPSMPRAAFKSPSDEHGAIRDVVRRNVFHNALHLSIPPSPSLRMPRITTSACTASTSRDHPPQSVHYWTSDRTRRLEYASIDAAERSARGWLKRHLIPSCMLPEDQRKCGFGDTGGSVRRYRLELADEACIVTEGSVKSRAPSYVVTKQPTKRYHKLLCM